MLVLLFFALYPVVAFAISAVLSNNPASNHSCCIEESKANGRFVAQFEPIWEAIPDTLQQRLNIGEVFIEKQKGLFVKKRNILVVKRATPWEDNYSAYRYYPTAEGWDVYKGRTKQDRFTSSFALSDTADQYDTIVIMMNYWAKERMCGSPVALNFHCSSY